MEITTPAPTDETEISGFAAEFSKDRPDLAGEISTLKLRAFEEGLSKRDFAKSVRELFQKKPARTVMKPVLDMELGMSRAEIEQFSFARALRSAVENNGQIKDCYEREVSDSVATKTGKRTEGFFVPSDVLLGGTRKDYQRNFQRDMYTGDFSVGGAALTPQFVQPIVEVLRNKVVCSRLGCRYLGGLTADAIIPRETSPNTAQNLSEIGQVNESDLSLDQIKLTPHRIAAQAIFGRQLIIQSGVAPDLEAFIQDDLMKVIAISHDEMLLNGSGGNDQPLGVLNQIGLNQVVFGGAPTFQTLISFLTALGKYNADEGRLAWATTPNARGIWQGTAVALTGATTVSAKPLWEPGEFTDDPTDGLVLGFRAAASNQIPLDRAVFGNWLELIYGQFSGFETIVDPFSRAGKAEIITTVNSWMDVAVRHPQSFTVSADSAAQ